MNKISKNQKGFTAVEGLLIVLILVVIGAVGYMVYHNDHKTKTVSVSTTAAKTSASSTAKVTPTTATIPITPLGISITVPIVLKDLTYAVTSQTSYNGDTSIEVGLSTTSLTNLDPTDCSASRMPLIGLVRVDGQYPADGTVYNTPGALVKQFSNFYIAYAENNGQTACSANSSAAAMASNDLPDLINHHDTTVNGTTTAGTPTPEFTIQALN